MKRNHQIILGTALLAAALVPVVAVAADHTDSPAAAADLAADLTDFYAWHKDNGNLVLITNFAGLQAAGSTATYDADVLYGIHADLDGDGVSDHDIWVRFGENGAGEWGVQVVGLPGEEPLVGPVGEALTSGAGAMVWAGAREDSFFFDFEGFTETLDTGTLAFDGTRDSFAGTNVTSIVIELDADALADGGDSLSLWATTGRKG